MRLMNKKGNLLILSGPSGVGKDAVLKLLLERNDKVRLSVSSVTRDMRPGEVNGVKYDFVSREYFENMINNGMLLEHNVYLGNYYGTPKKPVEDMINEGYTVILEIDVNGAMKVMKDAPDANSIFLTPRTIDILRERLDKRGTDDAEAIEKRLIEAKREIEYAEKYRYIVVNDTVEQAVGDIEAIIRANALENKKYKESITEVTENA